MGVYLEGPVWIPFKFLSSQKAPGIARIFSGGALFPPLQAPYRYQACKRDLAVRDLDKTETFHNFLETKTRTRLRFWVRGRGRGRHVQDRDRDISRDLTYKWTVCPYLFFQSTTTMTFIHTYSFQLEQTSQKFLALSECTHHIFSNRTGHLSLMSTSPKLWVVHIGSCSGY